MGSNNQDCLTLQIYERHVLVESKNVLVIEDEESICTMMQEILSLEGYNVIIARDGLEGFQKLKEISPAPCVVLLDLMMPKADGWWFLDNQRLDPVLSKVPVVVCSAYSESAKSVNPHDIVPKPVQLDCLLNAVKKFCA